MKTVIKRETKTNKRDSRNLLGKEVIEEKMNIQKENPFQLAEESRFYSERIEVETVNQSFYPSAFVWRGQRYVINKIIHSWPDSGYAKSTPNKRDWRSRHHRNYFVVGIDSGRVFKIYHDRGVKKESPRVWILSEELFMSKPRESVSSKDESLREKGK
ncbi:hypothetical protein E3J48_05635 [Candidatus Aerophobetes bacterium]|uniref:DUF6504 domain-containing protein n=1 Tax=Aerophobetes bacterium TaxID=2030807 RepID=A0A523W310_UNCAE|nr:MAG: hypothetical protein E3J48_05635 [Candidatus Aerophobetes bacterium]